MTDTGPPYPRTPAPPFVVGYDPIVSPDPFSIWDTVLSQYANSPVITALAQSLYDSIGPLSNFASFYTNIWNVDTASGYGLDVWGRIVALQGGRTVQVPSAIPPFGFSESTTAVGFGLGPFYTGTLTQNYMLSDAQFYRLILAKALANISDGSIPSINQILLTLFGDQGEVYVQDTVPAGPYFGFSESGTAKGFAQAPFYMAASGSGLNYTYVFCFTPTNVDLGMLNAGAVPRPLGTSAVTVVNLQTGLLNSTFTLNETVLG